MIVQIIVAFLVPVIISIILYFTLIKDKLCDGGRKLHKCANSDSSVCTNSSTDYAQMCGENKKPKSLLGNKNLKMAPGQGQCVEKTDKTIDNNKECNSCLSSYSGYMFYNNNPDLKTFDDKCKDAFVNNPTAEIGDVVALGYKTNKGRSYTCESPGIVVSGSC